MQNGRLILAGAAIGAYTQDPVDNPIAGLTGLGIGALTGSMIEPVVVGRRLAQSTLNRPSSISYNESAVKSGSMGYGRAMSLMRKGSYSIRESMNSADSYGEAIKAIQESYKGYGGTLDLSGLGDAYIGAYSRQKSSIKQTEQYLASTFGNNSEEFSRFVSALSSVGVSKNNVVDVNNNFQGYETVVSRTLNRVDTTGIPVTANRVSESVRLPVSMKAEERLDLVRSHLVSLGNQDSVADRIARNIVENTNGKTLELSGNKLSISANGKTNTLPLEQAIEGAGGRTGYIADNGDLLVAQKHNPFFLARNGAEFRAADGIGFNVHTNEGAVSSMNGAVRRQGFTTVEAALITARATGRDQDDIYERFSNANARIGNFQDIQDAIRRDGLGSEKKLQDLLSRSDTTSTSTQVNLRQGKAAGLYTPTFDSYTNMAMDIEADVNIKGNVPMYSGISNNSVGVFNIGNEDPGNIARMNYPMPEAGDRTHARVDAVLSTRNDAGNKILTEMANAGLDTSNYSTASALKVAGADASSSSILGYMGYSLDDGQGIARIGGLEGISSGESKVFRFGDSSKVSVSADMQDAMQKIAAGELEHFSFGSNAVLGVDEFGNEIKVPSWADNFRMTSVNLGEDGKLSVSGFSMHSPATSEQSTIKIFGDTKATFVKADDTQFRLLNAIREAENNIMATDGVPSIDENGNIHPKMVGMLKDSGLSYIDPDGNKVRFDSNAMTGDQLNAIMDNIVGKGFFVNRLEKRANVTSVPDLIIRGEDNKIGTTLSSIDRMTDTEVDDYVHSVFGSSNQVEAKYKMSPGLSNHAQNYLNGASGYQDKRNRLKGVMVALIGMSDKKSSSTAYATAALAVGKLGGGDTYSGAGGYMARLSNLTNDVIHNPGNADREIELFKGIVGPIVDTLSQGKQVEQLTLASTDFGSSRNINSQSSNSSWLQRAMEKSLGLNVSKYTGEADQQALFELEKYNRVMNNSGNNINEVFGEGDGARRAIYDMFNPNKSREEQFSNIIPEKFNNNGIASVSVSMPNGSVKSVSISKYDTSRSGVLINDGKNIVTELDKLNKNVLLSEVSYQEALKNGNEKAIKSSSYALEKAVGELDQYYRNSSVAIAKSALKVHSENGADLLLQAASQRHNKVAQEMINPAIGLREEPAFFNQEALRRLGMNINAQEGEEGFSKLVPYINKEGKEQEGMFRVVFGDENVPALVSTAREPVASPHNLGAKAVILDTRLDKVYGNKPVIVQSNYDVYGNIKAAHLSSADFDGDFIRTSSLVNAATSPEEYNRIREGQSRLLEAIAENRAFFASLNAKSGKGGGTESVVSSADNVFREMFNRAMSGFQRKMVAPASTELNEFVGLALRKTFDDKIMQVNEAHPVDSIGWKEAMETIRKERIAAYDTAGKIVESTLKATTSGGSTQTETLLNTLRESNNRQAVFEGFAEEFVSDAQKQYFKNIEGMMANEIDKINRSNLDLDAKALARDTLMQDIQKAKARIGDSLSIIQQAINVHGKDSWNDEARMVGNKNGRASAAIAQQLSELPTGATNDIIDESKDLVIDKKKTIINSLKSNQGKLIAGTAALAATTLFIGRDEPDTSSSISQSPVARTDRVLPPLREETAFITTPTDRSPRGSVEVYGSKITDFNSDSLRYRFENLVNGSTAGRTTVRFQEQ